MKMILNKIKSISIVKWLKVIILIMILFLFGSFLVTKITLPGALDLPRQIQNGNDILHGNFRVLTENVYSYTEPYHLFANHHWLFGVGAYILYQISGWVGLSVFKIIFILFTFVLLFWLAFKRSNFWMAAIFSIPTIFILINRTAFRPEIFSYFFVVIFLILLFDLEKNPVKNRIFVLIPIMLVWVNTHLFFPIGIMLVGGFLFEQIILNYKEWKTNKVIRKLFYVLIGLILMIFINPFGLSGVIYSLTVNTAATFPIHSMEVTTVFKAIQSDPSWANISIYVYLSLVVILLFSFISVFIYRIKNKISLFSNNFIFLFLASTGSAGLSYFIFRALPLFGSIFLISICSIGNDFFEIIKQKIFNKIIITQKFFSYFLIIILAVFIIYLFFISQVKIFQYQERGIGLAKESLSSVEFFKQNNLKGPIFNDTDSGSYLIGGLYPQERVFADNRFGDAYSADFFSNEYLPFIQDETKWKEGLKKYNFNVIFIYNYDMGSGVRDFVYKRINDPDWIWVYVDRYNVILVRNNLNNKDVIDKYRITYENVTDRLKYLIESKIASDKLKAADILNLVGRTDVSMPLYLRYLSLKPENGEIWFVLGRTELLKVDIRNSNPSLAAIYLEKAIDNNWSTWEAYSYLALAYYRTGQFDRMKEMVEKERRIVPNGEDTKIWVNLISDMNLKEKYDNAK